MSFSKAFSIGKGGLKIPSIGLGCVRVSLPLLDVSFAEWRLDEQNLEELAGTSQ